jgi:glycosyltransferase involved in cell wall biosynthesis
MRVLVVSHACTVELNRDVYRELASKHAHEVHVIVPAQWPVAFAASDDQQVRSKHALPVHELPVRMAGRIQQHSYRWRDIRYAVRTLRPDVLLIEEEPFSIAGMQWAAVARRNKLPYALQAAENLTSRVPGWLRPLVKWNLSRAGLVMARSHTAIAVARGWGATGAVEFLPHALPEILAQHAVQRLDAESDSAPRPFVIGYAGRLVTEKGIAFLVGVLRDLGATRPVLLLVTGRGPEEGQLQRLEGSGVTVERTTLAHEHMPDFYRRLDVLVVPSRTTPTWTEQFGRVITEAASFGVPTIGSASGEIPWVIEDLGAGVVVPENDVDAWRKELTARIDGAAIPNHAALRTAALERYSTASVASRINAALTLWMAHP